MRTTIDIPASLLSDINKALKKGVAKSRNAFVIQAVRSYLEQLRRQRIDEEFEAMQHDKRYLKLNLKLSEEFAKADWEAWQIGETSETKAGGDDESRLYKPEPLLKLDLFDGLGRFHPW